MTPAKQAGFRPARVGGCQQADLEVRADGSTVLTAREALDSYPPRLSDLLLRWASVAPGRTFVAKRHSAGSWMRITYAQMVERARQVGQSLLDAGLSADRPLAILSENDLEHATLMMAATWVGVPYVSVSTAYSLLSTDYERLDHILRTTAPGMVYASSAAYAPAIAAKVPVGVTIVLGEGGIEGRDSRAFADLLTTPTEQVDDARAATGPDTIVKFLFTSGSTRLPKGVVTTQRMLCANQQMLQQCMKFLSDEPPVLVDWLPWSHTFGGSHNLGIVLYNGGTLYIDEGKPTRSGIGETIRNLKEISPTVYFNVPNGFAELVRAMDSDHALRVSLFAKVKAFMFAAAGLSQTVWDALDAHAVAACGQRVRILTSLGMTETSPSSLFLVGTHARSGYVGLPCPGVAIKLVPQDGKTELRIRGPHVMPGYWKAPEQTAMVFDEDGYYCTGDAVRLVDPADLSQGLMFDGRLTEDFKLSTGTFVNAGPLRAHIALEGYPYVMDAVLTGHDRSELGVLIFPQIPDCADLSGLDRSADPAEILRHPRVKAWFQDFGERLYAAGSGSATRVARMIVVSNPPSVKHGEITDKGSINQRAVLAHRESLIERLYQGQTTDGSIIVPKQSTSMTG